MDLQTTDDEYAQNRDAVLGMLAKRFPRFGSDQRLELYHEAWVRALKKRERGEQVESLRAYLVQTAAFEAMHLVSYGRRPTPLDPSHPSIDSLVDGARTPDEQVEINDQVRICRELIDELEPRRRALFKLRWDLGMTPPEIRSALGMTQRQYKRLAKESMEAIAERVTELNDGSWSRRQRSLIAACLRGIASDSQRAEAQRRIRRDPHVAALCRELNSALERVAVALPLPAITELPPIEGRLAAAVDGLRAVAGELTTGAKHQATSLYVRGADATPLAGVRPGTVAATLTGCLALTGSATYCAVEGLPDAVRAPLGLERPASERSETVQPAPAVVVAEPPPTPPAPQPTDDTPAERAEFVPPAAPPTPESSEFGAEEPGAASAGSGAPAVGGSQPAPAAPAAGNELGFEH
jgi:RNA polymerase sigma factor (sigma-70 family)